MFNIGDKVVYPMHGAGIIQDIEEKNILGEKTAYYIIKMPRQDLQRHRQMERQQQEQYQIMDAM